MNSNPEKDTYIKLPKRRKSKKQLKERRIHLIVKRGVIDVQDYDFYCARAAAAAAAVAITKMKY